MGFGVHTTPGQALIVLTRNAREDGAVFRAADPDLAGYVVLDFGASHWWEEDELIIGHHALGRRQRLARGRRPRLSLSSGGYFSADDAASSFRRWIGYAMHLGQSARGMVRIT